MFNQGLVVCGGGVVGNPEMEGNVAQEQVGVVVEKGGNLVVAKLPECGGNVPCKKDGGVVRVFGFGAEGTEGGRGERVGGGAAGAVSDGGVVWFFGFGAEATGGGRGGRVGGGAAGALSNTRRAARLPSMFEDDKATRKAKMKKLQEAIITIPFLWIYIFMEQTRSLCFCRHGLRLLFAYILKLFGWWHLETTLD
jgi:hypothetical protein